MNGGTVLNFFNYESKFMQAMLTLADMIILNICFLICCIPIVTISAAQAGLYTGIRSITDPEDDRSVFKAFFRGFADGIVTSSVAGTVVLIAQAVSVWIFFYAYYYYGSNNSLLPLILSIVLMAAIYITHSLIGPFHSRFGCTIGQLIRNAFFVAFAYPLRSLAVGALTLLPLAILFIWPQIFMGGIIAVLAIYYSTAALLSSALLKKPFARLEESFNRANGIGQEGEEEQAEASEE